MLIRYLGTIISSVLVAFGSLSTLHLPLFFILFIISLSTAILPVVMPETGIISF